MILPTDRTNLSIMVKRSNISIIRYGDRREKCFLNDYCSSYVFDEQEDLVWITEQCEIMNIEWRLYNKLIYEYVTLMV